MTSARRNKILFLSIFLLPSLALANPGNGRRIALVIGNQSYSQAALSNPINDANDMAEALEACGFEVLKETDVNRSNMRKAVRAFGDKIRKGGVGLFYYSGHGLQIDGMNYLVPIGADVKRKYDVEDQCLKVAYVLGAMEDAGNKLNIVILDACRANPYRSFKGGDNGLAQMTAPSGSYLAFATRPGSVASDAPWSRNGLFTSRILKHIKTPGLRMVDLFMRVRKEVLAESNHEQEPWDNQSITEPFYFMEGGSEVEDHSQPEKKITNSIGQEFVLIPEGTFMMGSSLSAEEVAQKYGGKKEWYEHEQPRHKVNISKAFYLQTTEVTVGQWRNFIKDTGYKTEAETGGGAYTFTDEGWKKKEGYYWDHPGFEQAESHPVTCVSWNDVQEYLEWLNNKKSVYKYRLPTEAEWEYACRAGTMTVNYWGDDSSKACAFANVTEKTAQIKFPGWTAHDCKDGWILTAPVGSYKMNSFGLYDMIGNVWEWCQDVYSSSAYTEEERTDQLYAGSGSRRVVRGGSWGEGPEHCRSAYRNGLGSSARFDGLGFRLARSF